MKKKLKIQKNVRIQSLKKYFEINMQNLMIKDRIFQKVKFV